MGVPAIRIQALKMAIRIPQAVMDDRVYRAMVVTIQNFNLSINRVSSPKSIYILMRQTGTANISN
jgi:hypothetical protein